jgi:hypothetical protein
VGLGIANCSDSPSSSSKRTWSFPHLVSPIGYIACHPVSRPERQQSIGGGPRCTVRRRKTPGVTAVAPDPVRGSSRRVVPRLWCGTCRRASAEASGCFNQGADRPYEGARISAHANRRSPERVESLNGKSPFVAAQRMVETEWRWSWSASALRMQYPAGWVPRCPCSWCAVSRSPSWAVAPNPPPFRRRHQRLLRSPEANFH